MQPPGHLPQPDETVSLGAGEITLLTDGTVLVAGAGGYTVVKDYVREARLQHKEIQPMEHH